MQDISELDARVNGDTLDAGLSRLGRCLVGRYLTLLFLAFPLKERCVSKVENYRDSKSVIMV